MKKILLMVVVILTLHGCSGSSPNLSNAKAFLKNKFQPYESQKAGTFKAFTFEKVDGMLDKKSGAYVMYINVITQTLKQTRCDNFYPFSGACLSTNTTILAGVTLTAPMKLFFDKRESGWVPTRVEKDEVRTAVATPSVTMESKKEIKSNYKNEQIYHISKYILKEKIDNYHFLEVTELYDDASNIGLPKGVLVTKLARVKYINDNKKSIDLGILVFADSATATKLMESDKIYEVMDKKGAAIKGNVIIGLAGSISTEADISFVNEYIKKLP